MKESTLRYLLKMGAISAPTKVNKTAPVVLETPEEFLEEVFRSLSKILTLVLAPLGLILLGISMMPTVIKPMVLQGALFFLAGIANILETIAVGLSAVLTWLIGIPTFEIYW